MWSAPTPLARPTGRIVRCQRIDSGSSARPTNVRRPGDGTGSGAIAPGRTELNSLDTMRSQPNAPRRLERHADWR